MGVYYHYANFTKRERFSIGALGGEVKRSNLGYSLASRAFHLMLAGQPGGVVGPVSRGTIGRWAGDSIAILGDDITPDWGKIRDEFVNIEANAIILVYQVDGFEKLGDAAEREDSLFMELCHLVVTRQATELEWHMKQRFGTPYLQKYKELCAQRIWFEPKDLAEMKR